MCGICGELFFNDHPVKELRNTLKQMGYIFYSTGDTEVVLKAYHARGENCVEKFNGMFAFVVYDQDNDCAFMARDRLGIKPLYFYQTPDSLMFASFLPALLQTGKIKKNIFKEALHYYMSFHEPTRDTVNIET